MQSFALFFYPEHQKRLFVCLMLCPISIFFISWNLSCISNFCLSVILHVDVGVPAATGAPLFRSSKQPVPGVTAAAAQKGRDVAMGDRCTTLAYCEVTYSYLPLLCVNLFGKGWNLEAIGYV